MADWYGKGLTRREIEMRVGTMGQIAGVSRYTLNEGQGAGIEVAEVRTGSGLSFRVSISRGMDISFAQYRGVPLCWRSAVGDVAPEFFESEGLGWLRSFTGGLLTTCGLSYLGSPCEDGGESLGLHGRVSNLPAFDVSTSAAWTDNEYRIQVQGKVRETRVFGSNLLLTRRICTALGENRIWIDDTIENQGFEPAEHMILYHVNCGFPVLDVGSRLLIPSRSVRPRDNDAAVGLSQWKEFGLPVPGFREQVFYHELVPDEYGWTQAAVVNPSFAEVCGSACKGIGVYVRYRPSELPEFIEWKMTGAGNYVVGMEPSTSLVEGRPVERQRGKVIILNPGEAREYHLELGVLVGTRIDAFRRDVEHTSSFPYTHIKEPQ